MNEFEEYEIVREKTKNDPIILDGKYFSDISNKFLGKFKNQASPEVRVQKIKENEENICYTACCYTFNSSCKCTGASFYSLLVHWCKGWRQHAT